MTTHNQDKISIRDYVDTRIEAVNSATKIAYTSMDSRLLGMNEFRNQLKDQTATFINRNEFNTTLSKHEDDIGLLRVSSERMVTKMAAIEKESSVSSNQIEARLLSMNEFRLQLKDQAGTFFTKPEHEIYSQSVEKDLRMLRESKATLEGKATSLSVNISTTIAIIGVILAVLSFFRGTFTVSESAQKPAITYPLPTK